MEHISLAPKIQLTMCIIYIYTHVCVCTCVCSYLELDEKRTRERVDDCLAVSDCTGSR